MNFEIKHAVQERYGAVARSGLSSETPGAVRIAEAFGYSADELASIPTEANMGLSCGNPTATANLRPGEIVVDLGSGGGLDVFLAAQKVGPTGKAIGIDMTQDMIDRARKGAAKAGLANVEFHLAEIENLPLPSNRIDCIISNCVLNLVPDKSRAMAEIFRVLKPGGRLAVSDIALKKPLPEDLGKDIVAYIGCIAGAILVEEYEKGLTEAGFVDIMVVDTQADLNAYTILGGDGGCCSGTTESTSGLAVIDSCCSPSLSSDAQQTLHEALTSLISRYDINEYAASVRVFALKPH